MEGGHGNKHALLMGQGHCDQIALVGGASHPSVRAQERLAGGGGI